MEGVTDLSQFSSTWILQVIGLLTLVGGVVKLWLDSRNLKLSKLPPGPRNWPIIGALFEMEPKLHIVLDKFAKRYGPIVYFRLGVQDIVVVSTAETAEELLKHKDAEFKDRETQMTRSARKYTAFDGGMFPFADYDDDLKLHRKLFNSELFSVSKLKTYETVRTREVAAIVEHIFKGIQSSSKEEQNGDHNPEYASSAPVAVREITETVPRNIMFTLAVGTRFDSLPPTDELREFPLIVDEIMEIVMTINIVDFFPALTWLDPQGLIKRMKAFDKMQTRYYERILERSRRGTLLDDASKSSSYVQTLLRAQREGTEISDNGIMSSLVSLLNGGIDTTGSQMEWVILHLARNPKVLKRLQDEIDAVVGKERPLEESDLQALPYLNAVALETMRLNPVLPYSFPHVNFKPSTLCGYNIPANTAVLLNMYSLGRDPKRWKDPLQFNPERFMVGGTDPTFSPETVKANGNCFYLLPFGGGRRVCPGYNLGFLLLLRTVGTLVHAFHWSPPPGCSPEDLSVADEGTIILQPSPKLFLVPTSRLSSHIYKSNIAN